VKRAHSVAQIDSYRCSEASAREGALLHSVAQIDSYRCSEASVREGALLHSMAQIDSYRCSEASAHEGAYCLELNCSHYCLWRTTFDDR
jgi:hypothetical protein